MLPKRRASDARSMVTHVSYIELHTGTAVDCIEAIREQLELGWRLSQVRGPRRGPFALLFRKEEDAQ